MSNLRVTDCAVVLDSGDRCNLPAGHGGSHDGGFGEALRRIADEYGACPSCYRFSTFRKLRDGRGSVVGGVCGQCRYESSTQPLSAATTEGSNHHG